MSHIAILGAGAFGTALALTLAREGRAVTLWAREAAHACQMARARENARRLPGHSFPDTLAVTDDLESAVADSDPVLIAVPMQSLAGFVAENAGLLATRTLVSCCKGIDLSSGLGPAEVIQRAAPGARMGLLSGPSFAADIAGGLPTALTLAAQDGAVAETLQERLSTACLRLYRSTDVTGVELTGAVKNVIAIACGAAIGAGLGESARAALMTRGFAEMRRHALARGAREETLAGLSGLGDLALTCTSEKSRNYRFGLALGREGRRTATETTEGIATAQALAARTGDEMPVTQAVAALVAGSISVAEAAERLLSRPLRAE